MAKKKIKKNDKSKKILESSEFDVNLEEEFLPLNFYIISFTVIAIIVTILFKLYFIIFWN